jgi:anthranilate/para-aminobenzoate synthase component I
MNVCKTTDEQLANKLLIHKKENAEHLIRQEFLLT